MRNILCEILSRVYPCVMTSNTDYHTDLPALSTLDICLDSVWNNVQAIQSKLGNATRLMAIVKASAYGTDMITMTRALQAMGVDIFGVATVAEGVALRKSGVTSDLFVIHTPIFDLQHIPSWDLQTAISCPEAIETLEYVAGRNQKRVKVHLHVNTGMNRFGCHPEDAFSLAHRIHASPWLQLEGVMSHFHSSDIPENDDLSFKQVDLFDEVIRRIEKRGIPIPWKHIANSGAICRFNLSQYNMARVGIAMHGIHLSDACEKALPLDLAVTLRTKIIDIKSCRQGDTLSYEAAYTVKDPQERIGVLGIGYHDGLHRHYGKRGFCCLNGHLIPFVGNICMDFALINLSDVVSATIGDEVTIFGRDSSGRVISPRELSTAGETCAHELVACLGPRIKRVFKSPTELPSDCLEGELAGVLGR